MVNFEFQTCRSYIWTRSYGGLAWHRTSMSCGGGACTGRWNSPAPATMPSCHSLHGVPSYSISPTMTFLHAPTQRAFLVPRARCPPPARELTHPQRLLLLPSSIRRVRYCDLRHHGASPPRVSAPTATAKRHLWRWICMEKINHGLRGGSVAAQNLDVADLGILILRERGERGLRWGGDK